MKTPLKSVAAALVFGVILGPIGLLYASFWGGFFMIFVGMVVIASHQMFPIILLWVISTIWAVGAAESYNKGIINACEKRLSDVQ